MLTFCLKRALKINVRKRSNCGELTFVDVAIQCCSGGPVFCFDLVIFSLLECPFKNFILGHYLQLTGSLLAGIGYHFLWLMSRVFSHEHPAYSAVLMNLYAST